MSTQYITIKQASKILGVTPLTLRNWDKNGKLKALRHPINNYRVYKMEDIEGVLNGIASSAKKERNKEKEVRRIIVKHL